MTIKELEEAINSTKAEFHAALLALNERQDRQSVIEKQIDDLRTEFYEVQEQIGRTYTSYLWAQSKLEEFEQELSRRTKSDLGGTKLPHPVPMVCG